MRRQINALLLFCAVVVSAPLSAMAVTIAWSPVGDPGNAADPATGSNYGAVASSYSIGTYDVTASQYVEFLNTKDPNGDNTLELYWPDMSEPTHGGIDFNAGNLPGNKYSVISGRGNHPVNYVNWYSAVRFANWLNNGQGAGDTETGAYILLGGTPTPSNANSITRQPGATVFLPSVDEWYKAAFYDPGTSSYFQSPTSSNTLPTSSAPTALPNHVNGSPNGPGTLTDVGAYTGTTSPYGAFDMAGNVGQWNEDLISGTFRSTRGTSFFDATASMVSSSQGGEQPWFSGQPSLGFRVASVPEPSTFVLGALGACMTVLAIARRRPSCASV